MRSLIGIARILIFKTDFPRVIRFPVPLDKHNEGSADKIDKMTVYTQFSKRGVLNQSSGPGLLYLDNYAGQMPNFIGGF